MMLTGVTFTQKDLEQSKMDFGAGKSVFWESKEKKIVATKSVFGAA